MIQNAIISFDCYFYFVFYAYVEDQNPTRGEGRTELNYTYWRLVDQPNCECGNMKNMEREEVLENTGP